MWLESLLFKANTFFCVNV